MNILTNMRTHCNNYINQVPSNVAPQAVKSFAVAFVAATIMTKNPQLGLVYGSLCATATVIHALITPLFKRVLSPAPSMNWLQEMVRGSLAIIATACIASSCGIPFAINHLAKATLFYGIRVAIGGLAAEKSFESANVMFV